jgi:hypothetical protein
MKLRYTGTVPTSFYGSNHATGEVSPGATFDVPDEQGRRFLQHGLIEPVDKAAKALWAEMTKRPAADSDDQAAQSEPDAATTN